MDEDLMEETRDEIFVTLWRKRKLIVWLLVVLLVLALIFFLRLAHKRQEELTQEMEKQNQQMEYQEQLIIALRESSGMNKDNDKSIPVITSDTIKEQLSSIQELVTQEYIYTNSDKGEDLDEWIFGWDRPFSEKSYIVTYDGTIKAGINLSDAVVEVDEESHTITIILPPSKITDNNVPQESVVTHNIKNGLFNDVTYEDLNNLVAQGKIRMEVKAVERGLLTKADEEARTLVKSFLSLIPGIGSGEGEYTLIVQTSS